jgi:hypothetical protein
LRQSVLSLPSEAYDQLGLVALNYCLMPNHNHLLAQTPWGNLSQAAGQAQATWAARLNRRHRMNAKDIHQYRISLVKRGD